VSATDQSTMPAASSSHARPGRQPIIPTTQTIMPSIATSPIG
jgi:hypothetical protein